MMLPLNFGDISILLALTGLILLVASGLFSAQNCKVSILINKNKLKKVAITISILFLSTVAIQLITLLIT
jgi:hypothetical protein